MSYILYQNNQKITWQNFHRDRICTTLFWTLDRSIFTQHSSYILKAEVVLMTFFQISKNIMGCHRHTVLFSVGYFNFSENNTGCLWCCSQLWVWHMFCGQDLWWIIPLHIFHWSCSDTIWIPNDHMDLCQTHCVQVPDFFCLWGHMVNLDQSQASLRKLLKIGSFQFLPTGLHGSCFGCCFSSPLPLRSLPSKRSTHRGPFPRVPNR